MSNLYYKKVKRGITNYQLHICNIVTLYIFFIFQRNKRILEKATTTHKERVEKFNEHLDTLTEHFDIPKVSWTK